MLIDLLDYTITDLLEKSTYILNLYDIQYTEKEFLTMKLTDGLYFEENAGYLKSYNPTHKLKTSLPHVLHWADHMSTKIEVDFQDNAPF